MVLNNKKKKRKKIKQKGNKKGILTYIDEDVLNLLDSIIPNYKRSPIIENLIKEYIGKHSMDKQK